MRYLRLSLDYRLSRLTSPLPLTDITIDWIFHSEPSIATFSLFPSRHKLSVQCIIGPIIQFNDPVKWILAAASDSKSLEKLRVSVESQQSQACAGLGCSLMLADLGGQQRFVQFNRIIPRIKTEIPASKESSEAAVPCVQGRIFADSVDKKVTWDVLCLALNLGIKYLLPAHPALNIAQYREPLTHTRHGQNILRAFSCHQEFETTKYIYCSSLHLQSFVHHSSLDDWSWNTESIKCTQIAVMTISELRSLRA